MFRVVLCNGIPEYVTSDPRLITRVTTARAPSGRHRSGHTAMTAATASRISTATANPVDR